MRIIAMKPRGYAVLDVSDDCPDVREGDTIIGVPSTRGYCVVCVEKRDVTFSAFCQGSFSFREEAESLPFR